MHHLIERARFPDCIDATMLSAFTKCPSYFYLRYVLGLEKRDQEGSATAGRDWGSVWHQISDTLIKTGSAEEALSRIEPWPEHITPDLDRHGRSKQRMIRIFFDYLDRWEADARKYEIVRSEQFFQVEIPLVHDVINRVTQVNDRRSFEWCGRMDRIARNRETGDLFVWDQKTTSYLTSVYLPQLEFGYQIPGYVVSAEQLTTEPVEKALVDVLHTLKNEHKFLRQTFRYSEARKREWKENTWRILQEMYRLRDHHLHEPEAWAKHWNRCTDFFKPCQFSDVHWLTADGDTRLRILDSEYEERRWDPATTPEEERNGG